MTKAVIKRLAPVKSADLMVEAKAELEFASLNLQFLDYNAQNVKVFFFDIFSLIFNRTDT